MESTARWSLVTALAPIAWGTSYFVTQRYLPADHPLYGAVFRALPAGILLLALSRGCRTARCGGRRWCWAP